MILRDFPLEYRKPFFKAIIAAPMWPWRTVMVQNFENL